MAKKNKADTASEEHDEPVAQATESEASTATEPEEAEARRPARTHRKRRALAQPTVVEEEPPPDIEPPQGEDDEDPIWWTPHLVLSVLVLVGLFGFFGAFNKPLAFLAAKPVGSSEPETAAVATGASRLLPPRPPPSGAPAAQAEMFGAKHLLVMYKGSRRAPADITRTKDEAKARAAEAQKKAKSGSKFEELVKSYSDEPGAGQRGGDLGRFPKGAMAPPFQAAVEKLKVGETSEVVETDFGFHVIVRTQ